jgi:hypothetical protein
MHVPERYTGRMHRPRRDSIASFRIGDEPDAVSEWRTRSIDERLQAALRLRVIFYGESHLTERLRGVLESGAVPWSTDPGVRRIRSLDPRPSADDR